jgi:hypothetical protein
MGSCAYSAQAALYARFQGTWQCVASEGSDVGVSALHVRRVNTKRKPYIVTVWETPPSSFPTPSWLLSVLRSKLRLATLLNICACALFVGYLFVKYHTNWCCLPDELKGNEGTALSDESCKEYVCRSEEKALAEWNSSLSRILFTLMSIAFAVSFAIRAAQRYGVIKR